MNLSPSRTLRTAEKHISRGRIDAAIEEYRKLVNWQPSDLTTLNTLGDLYVRAGLTEQAGAIFSRVAQGYRHQGFTSKAIAILKKLLRLDPKDLDSAVSLAECYVAQGLRGEAGRHFAEVAGAYERAGCEDKALNTYQRMAEIDPSNTSMLMTLGERWLREGLRQRAHASFTAAGDEFCRQGNDVLALPAYLKAQAAQPDEHKTLAAISSICAARGEAGTAIPILCESLSRNPSDAELCRILGSAYLSTGRLEDAEETFQKLLTLDGSEYRNLLIVGEKFLETGDLDRAVSQIDGFVDTLIANRNEQEAVGFLNKALDRNPEHPGSLRRLARIFRRLREDFYLTPTLNAIAAAALKRGDCVEAIEALKELCSLEPHEAAHRNALERLGVDAPATPLAVCSTTQDTPKHETLDDVSQSGGAHTPEDLSPNGYTDDSVAVSRWTRPSESDNLELHLALKQIYAGENVLDSAAREYVPKGQLSQAGWAPAVAAHEFVAAGDIRGTASLSQRSGFLPPAAPNTAVTDFDVLPTSNRRQTDRVSARVPVVVISDSGGWREYTQTADVSDDGLALQLAHPVPPMTVLRVMIEMAKWPDRVARIRALKTTEGIVRHCVNRPGKPNLVGVELQLAPDTSPAEQ